ncbi:MAG: DUF4832 domain-containing protein [Thermogutta sp.]
MWRNLLVFAASCAIIVLSTYAERIGGQEWVTVKPEETDEILANPGMGWETFHRPADRDRNLPAWIPSTVQYARWGWGKLEPEYGKIDYEFLDQMLAESRRAGQKLAFRVMCCSTTRGNPYHPAWLREIGGRVIVTKYDNTEGLEVPDLDDPVVLGAHLDFLRRLAARYDGHPDLDHVDLGSVGWWGEWHMSRSDPAKMPTVENQKAIIDTYVSSFKKTPLLMLIDGPEMLRYATERGTGWRADCLGDMGGFSRNWCHMRNAYPATLTAAEAIDVWKHGPVAWETCWDFRKWVTEGWSLRYIFNYALALHASYINNKSAPLPPGEEVKGEVERFLRRLGYRLVLREVSHLPQVAAGEKLPIKMKWQNIGSAPCYRTYPVAYRFRHQSGRQFVVVSQTITANQFLPGSVPVFTEQFLEDPPELPPGEITSMEDAIQLPANMPAGEYELAVAIVESNDQPVPVVRLAIRGRSADGWYPISRVSIQAGK